MIAFLISFIVTIIISFSYLLWKEKRFRDHHIKKGREAWKKRDLEERERGADRELYKVDPELAIELGYEPPKTKTEIPGLQKDFERSLALSQLQAHQQQLDLSAIQSQKLFALQIQQSRNLMEQEKSRARQGLPFGHLGAMFGDPFSKEQ